MILIDTNVLVYAIQEGAPQHADSRRLVEAAAEGCPLACLFPQILLEFLAIITDARRLEKPATGAEAADLVRKYSDMFPVLHPSPAAMNVLISLVGDYSGVRGQRIFDSYLVAQMMDSGIDTICTYNTKDFRNYPISARTPDQVMKNAGSSSVPLVHDRQRPPC